VRIVLTPPRKPLIGAVEAGPGRGFELLLACDMIVALARTLRCAGSGNDHWSRRRAAFLLPRRIPYAIAMELYWPASRLTHREQQKSGSSTAGRGGRCRGRGGRTAAAIAANDRWPSSRQEIARRSTDWTLTEGWEQQRAIAEPVFASEDASEGARAFAERAIPVLEGTLTRSTGTVGCEAQPCIR